MVQLIADGAEWVMTVWLPSLFVVGLFGYFHRKSGDLSFFLLEQAAATLTAIMLCIKLTAPFTPSSISYISELIHVDPRFIAAGIGVPAGVMANRLTNRLARKLAETQGD